MKGEMYKRFRRAQKAASLRLKEERQDSSVLQYETLPATEEPDYDIFTTPPDRVTAPEMKYVDEFGQEVKS